MADLGTKLDTVASASNLLDAISALTQWVTKVVTVPEARLRFLLCDIVCVLLCVLLLWLKEYNRNVCFEVCSIGIFIGIVCVPW